MTYFLHTEECVSITTELFTNNISPQFINLYENEIFSDDGMYMLCFWS